MGMLTGGCANVAYGADQLPPDGTRPIDNNGMIQVKASVLKDAVDVAG